jgi:hypothetical protein
VSQVVEDLTAARDLIQDPSRWTLRVLARDTGKGEVVPESDLAACWCMAGALMKVCGRAAIGVAGDRYVAAWGVVQRVTDARFKVPPTVVNDTRGHDAVMAVYAEAIRLATEEVPLPEGPL